MSAATVAAPQTPRHPARVLLSLLEEHGLAEHAVRVSALSAAMCRQMGISPRAARVIDLAALLHDVGELAAPDDRDPAVVGEQALLRCPGLECTATLVRHVGERFDGRGRPDGLKGNLIPLGSRIIAVADAWDNALSYDAAVETVIGSSGTRFDPAVVAAVMAVAPRP